MKRIKLKRWVQNLLIIINLLSIMIFASDSNSTTMFITTKILSLIIFIINSYLLYKYTDLFKEDLK